MTDEWVADFPLLRFTCPIAFIPLLRPTIHPSYSHSNHFLAKCFVSFLNDDTLPSLRNTSATDDNELRLSHR
jgi:hypothetical protein